VFTRASGKPVTRGIPGLFTHHGYHNVFLPEARAVLGKLEREEAWVLGRAAHPAGRQAQDLLQGTVQRDMRRLYLHEYVAHWDEYLADVRLVDSQSIAQSREAARILSAPDSPVAQFLTAVARETRLSKPTEQRDTNSFLGRAQRRLTTEASTVERLIGPSNLNPLVQREEQLERIVDDRFAAIHQLVDSGSGNAPIQSVLTLFGELYQGLASAESAAQARTLAAPPTEVLTRVRSQAAYLPMPLRGMLEGLADSSAAQADGNVRRSLGAELDASVGNFCRNAVTGRYPFQRASQRNVTLADFQSLFAPGGRFDQFFSSRLSPMADVTGPTWVLRQPGGAQVPLTAFQNAARIREVFFPSGGRAMDLSFEFRVLEMDASIEQLTLDFDGQTFRYAHGPQLVQRVAWPGPRGTNQIRLTASSRSHGETYLSKDGPWALFRLFDEGDLRSAGAPERFIASLQVSGKPVVLEVVANSVQNPFRMREISSFNCPSRI
jgi:type VI secretion system protein ImpL